MGNIFNITLFAKRLEGLMNENDDTTRSLGEFLKLSHSTISRYMAGKIIPKSMMIQAIAIKYGVNPVWLMGAEGAEKYLYENRTKKIPVIGTIAAGQPIMAEEHIEYYEVVSESENVDMCLIVKGDSMSGARILSGDVVFIRKQSDVEDGEIAVVLIDDEATLKRVYKVNGNVILHAENPSYKDIVISAKDYKSVTILGKATSFKAKL